MNRHGEKGTLDALRYDSVLPVRHCDAGYCVLLHRWCRFCMKYQHVHLTLTSIPRLTNSLHPGSSQSLDGSCASGLEGERHGQARAGLLETSTLFPAKLGAKRKCDGAIADCQCQPSMPVIVVQQFDLAVDRLGESRTVGARSRSR